MAIREDETAAAAMGINTVTSKLLAFSLGASFSGFAGAFSGAYQTAIFADAFKFQTSILIVVMIILGGIGSLRGVIIGAFAVQYVNYEVLPWGAEILNEPIQAIGEAIEGIPIIGIASGLLSTFNLVNYSFLLFGVILAVMMVKRPEGLFPVETARAEMHGIGIASELTGAGDSELAAAEEEELAVLEAELAEEGLETGISESFADDTPPASVTDHDLPEDTR